MVSSPAIDDQKRWTKSSVIVRFSTNAVKIEQGLILLYPLSLEKRRLYQEQKNTYAATSILTSY